MVVIAQESVQFTICSGVIPGDDVARKPVIFRWCPGSGQQDGCPEDQQKPEFVFVHEIVCSGDECPYCDKPDQVLLHIGRK